VSAALALWLKPALARVSRRRDARGLALLGASFALFVAGFLSATPTAIGIAVVGAVAGGALALRGAEALRTLAFPVGYLLFMVPLPHSLVDPLIAQLRLLTTALAVRLLQLFALPVMHEGNVVVLPQERLFVAEACSGINSLLALLPAAILLGYFRQRRGARIALVAAVVPIALFWNLVRLLGTTLAALELPNQPAVTGGPLHELAGLLTFALGCLSLIGVDAWVQRRQPAIRSAS
jgi:exosortase